MTDSEIYKDEEKRLKIYKAAEPVFARFGYRKTTVEDICSSAGISKRTFYQLFRHKGHLFGSLLIHRTEVAVQQWIKQLPSDLSSSDKLLSFIELYADLMVTRPLIRLLYESQEAMDAFRELDLDLGASPTTQFLTTIIENGKATGEFRQVDTRSALIIILSVIRSMYLLIPMYTPFPGAADDAVLEQETVQFILHGLKACSEEENT